MNEAHQRAHEHGRRTAGCVIAVVLTLGMLAESTRAAELVGATKGIQLYLAGDYEAASLALATEMEEQPGQTALPLYLGLARLGLDDIDGATEAWTALLAADPTHPQAADLRRHLAILSKRAALDLISAPPQGGRLDARRVAVLRFESDDSEISTLGRGLAVMVISDLSKVEDLEVLDHVRVDALAAELALSAAGLTTDAAPEVGRLLAARRVASGSLTGGGAEPLDVTAVLSDVETSVQLGATRVSGPIDAFFDLQKGIVLGLLEGLGIEFEQLPDTLRDQLETPHTTNFEAFSHFSRGVSLMDQGQYEASRVAFRQAVEEDPDFDLARARLIAVPFVALSTATISAAIEGGAVTAGIGVTSTAAASASVAAGSALGSSIAGGGSSAIGSGATVTGVGASGVTSSSAAAAAAAAVAVEPATGLVALLPASILGVSSQAVLIGVGTVAVVGGVTAVAVAADDGGSTRSSNVRVEVAPP